jgi:non-ribosomal peptide synthetase component E (peptide arylation enzyme)
METILTFAILCLLVIAGCVAVSRSKRYAAFNRRESLESLACLCDTAGLNQDEAKRVKAAIECRLQQE